METTKLTTKVNIWLREHLEIKTPAKLLGGLALGALVMAATVLPLGPGLAYADEPARPLSIEQMENLANIFQTEVWLPGDTYPAASIRSDDLPGFMHTEVWLPGDNLSYFATAGVEIIEEPVLAGRYREAGVTAAREETGIFEETVLPGRYREAHSGAGVGATGGDLPGFMQTEIYLPGDTYPVAAADIPEFMQTEVWLPGDTYPSF